MRDTNNTTSHNSGHTAPLRPNSAKPNFVCPQNVIRNWLRDTKDKISWLGNKKRGDKQ